MSQCPLRALKISPHHPHTMAATTTTYPKAGICKGKGCDNPAMPTSGMCPILGPNYSTCKSCKCESGFYCFSSGSFHDYNPKIPGSSFCTPCTEREIRMLTPELVRAKAKIKKMIDRGAWPARFEARRAELQSTIDELRAALSRQ